MKIASLRVDNRGEGADNVSAFILCGGQSRRMGRSKAALTLGHNTFLETTTQVVANMGIKKLYCVGQQGCDFVDEVPFRGPGAALINALSQFTRSSILSTSPQPKEPASNTVLVVPVDMPLLTPESLSILLKHARRKRRSVYFENECFPLVLYDVKRLINELQALASFDESPSMRAIIKVIDAEGIATPARFKPSLMNVNTPDDYALIS